MSESHEKPLGRKAYGSIGHLPGSRQGPGDHHIPPGQAKICTGKVRDRHDVVIVTEKVDGSCVAIARLDDGSLAALGRAGWLAQTSPYEQHQLFAAWVREHYVRFDTLLRRGERLVGEWLAQAHGTRYNLSHEPFVPFDLMQEETRTPYQEFVQRVALEAHCTIPRAFHHGNAPCSIQDAMVILETSFHGALDPVEGAVWRVERHGKVDFLAKYVKESKIDGMYLPEMSGKPPVWNWRPA